MIVVGGSGRSRTSSSSGAPGAIPPRKSSESGTTSSDGGDQQPQRAPTAGSSVDRSMGLGASAAGARDTRRTDGLARWSSPRGTGAVSADVGCRSGEGQGPHQGLRVSPSPATAAVPPRPPATRFTRSPCRTRWWTTASACHSGYRPHALAIPCGHSTPVIWPTLNNSSKPSCENDAEQPTRP